MILRPELAEHLAVGETVGYPVCGIAAGVYGKPAFQFVMAGFVQQITDRNYTGHSSTEEYQLAGGSTLAERLCHGIQFLSSPTQVTMGDAKVCGLERPVADKERPVG